MGNQSRTGVAALDMDSGALMSWNPSFNGGINALVVSGTTLYVVGSFTGINGQSRTSFAAFDPLGSERAYIVLVRR